MEKLWIFCTIPILYLIYLSAVIPFSKKACEQTDGSCDCSDRNLQSIPDEVSSSTKELDFSFNYLPVLYNITFGRLKDLVSLDLTRCRIAWMYEDIFHSQTELQRLILIGNPLTFMAYRAFSGPQFLTHLSLAETSVRSLKDVPIAELSYLKSLDLRSCDIHSLDGLSNFVWYDMKRLDLDLNSLQNISKVHLSMLTQMTEMDVSFKGNDIVYIEPRAFETLKFNSLDFSGCLTSVDISVILQGLSGVKTNILKLGMFEDSPKTYLKTESLRAFCNISVRELNFQLQHFSDLTNSTFECLTGLQKLDLTRVHIKHLPANMSNMGALSHLVLNENAFSDVCDINADNFPFLKTLSMQGNVARSLSFQESCLRSLSQLQWLDLSHSGLKMGGPCCNKQLTGLDQLQFLNLSYNLAMQCDPLPFNATPRLQHLDLSHLKLNLNTSAPFRNLQQLQSLNLSWASTDFANVHLLEGLGNLRLLNLRGNPIQGGVVSSWEIQFQHFPLLERLVLSACGITAVEENAFQLFTKLAYVDLSENHLVGLSTSAFFSLKQIQLNFARNAIVMVNLESIKYLGENSTVDLSYNPLVCNCSNIQLIKWVQSNENKLTHIEETVCETAQGKMKISDVHLHCDFLNGMIAFGVIAGSIAVAVIVFIIVKKMLSRRYARYTQL